MTPDQLITFAAVAEHRNISRAAVALHLSQPAVSGQLRQLQDEFGEPLYLRDGRGVRLTPAGEQLASYATPASYLLPYLIADFHRRYPDVTLHTADGNTTEIVGALGSVDIAMIEGPVGADLPPDTAVHAWREDEIVAIMPRTHPLAQAVSAGGSGIESGSGINGGRAELAAFGPHPLVLREAGSGVRQIVERAFARAGVPMRVALEIAGVEGVKEAVRAGMGIGFVSAMSMRHEDGALCLFSLSPEPLTRRLSILVPHASAPSRVVEQFLALCLVDGA